MAKYIYCNYCNTKNKTTNPRCTSCGVGLYANISSQVSKFEKPDPVNKKRVTKTPLKKCIDTIFGILLSGLSALLLLAVLGAIVSPPIEWNMFLGITFMGISCLILAVFIFTSTVMLYGFCIFSIFWFSLALTCFNSSMTSITDTIPFYFSIVLAVISIIPFIIVNKKK